MRFTDSKPPTPTDCYRSHTIKGKLRRNGLRASPYTRFYRFYWRFIYREKGGFPTESVQALQHPVIGHWVSNRAGTEDVLYMTVGCETHPVDHWPHKAKANHWDTPSPKMSEQATRLAAKTIIAHMGA